MIKTYMSLLAFLFMFLSTSGTGIVIAGIWYTVTGSGPLGVAVAAIGIVLIAVAFGADLAHRWWVYWWDEWQSVVSRVVSEYRLRDIEALLGGISNAIDKEGQYIVAAIVAATGMPRGSGDNNLLTPTLTANAGVPPLYVTAGRQSVAAEVLKQRLAGRTHEQALLFTAEKFGGSESVISEAWDTDRVAAYMLVMKEADREGWEFTANAEAILREISPSEIERRKWLRQQVDKKHGRLDEVIISIREDFIRKIFQERVKRGVVVLDDDEEEARELLDELRQWRSPLMDYATGRYRQWRNRMEVEEANANAEAGSEEEHIEAESIPRTAGAWLAAVEAAGTSELSNSETAYLPSIETVMEIISDLYSNIPAQKMKKRRVMRCNCIKSEVH